jgi:hypothetical protein
MTIVSLAVLVSANVLLKLSAKAKSILSTPISASSVVHVPMFVLLKLSAWDNLGYNLKEIEAASINGSCLYSFLI